MLRRRRRACWHAAIGAALGVQILGLLVAAHAVGGFVVYFVLIPLACLLGVLCIGGIINAFMLAAAVANEYEGGSRWAFALNAPTGRPDRLEAWAEEHGYTRVAS